MCVIPQYLFCAYLQKSQRAGAPAAAVLMSRKELLNPFDSDEEEDDPYRDLIRAADQPAADQPAADKPAADEPADQSCADITANTTEQPSTLLLQLSSSQPTNSDANNPKSGQYQHMDW